MPDDLSQVVAFILFLGVVTYACFGGADFGAGVWDLTAGTDRRGGAMRALIDRAIGPVWEANHTWLIFVLVYLWSGFPDAFASIMETLWIPFSFAGLGIVLRGAAFAFRKFAPTMAFARLYGVLFAGSSLITPFFFGCIVGAIASGRVSNNVSARVPGSVIDQWSAWTGPASLIGGTLAVLTCAFLAAVFLCAEAARGDDQSLLAACRRRALATGAVTGIALLTLLFPLRHDAPELFDELTGRALPLMIISALAGVSTLMLLFTRRFSIARGTALVAVATVVLGWGIGQYPWILMNELLITDAAGADATLVGLIVVFAIAAITVVPALVYLYWVTQRPAWAGDKH